jgi:hypothetical protein
MRCWNVYHQETACRQGRDFTRGFTDDYGSAGQPGSSEDTAGHLFHQVFVEALADKNNPEVRLAGATGLIGMIKMRPSRFSRSRIWPGRQPGIRQMVFDLAGQVGNKDDSGMAVNPFRG